MAVAAANSSTERNKMIAAAVLGVVALFALYMAFGRGLFSSSSTKATTAASPTPKPASSPGVNRPATSLPSADEQDFVYQTTPVDYRPGSAYAPDAGRNIFAFYEPPPPCKGADCPTPLPPPVKTPPPPTATPTPPMLIAFANPQTVFAGSKAFRLELTGERFSGEARIYFNQVEMPTTFVNTDKLYTEIPANLIAQEGSRQVIVQTPDGRLYSNQFMLSVQPPPKPGYQYIGMIARKRYNNDTAYLVETGKDKPFGARLNDIVGGRFRLVDISAAEVVFEDTNLGFRHSIPVTKNSGSTGSTGPTRPGIPNDPSFPQFNPGGSKSIPGIPDSIPRYVPPQQVQPGDKRPIDKKEDVDDDGDGR